MTQEEFDYRFLMVFLGLGITLALSQTNEIYHVKATRQDGKCAFGENSNLAFAIRQAMETEEWSYHD